MLVPVQLLVKMVRYNVNSKDGKKALLPFSELVRKDQFLSLTVAVNK